METMSDFVISGNFNFQVFKNERMFRLVTRKHASDITDQARYKSDYADAELS